MNHVVDYFPYGKVLREYKPGEAERFLTTYHQRDQETGLDYRGARFYDSDIGRFLSLDPLAADYPSLSDYNYVAGNPIFFTDPTGQWPDPPEWVKNTVAYVAGAANAIASNLALDAPGTRGCLLYTSPSPRD